MCCVELVSHAEEKRALDDCDVLIGWMKMRRDPVAIGQVQPDCERRRFAWVSLKHRHFCAGWKNCGCRTPDDRRRLRQQGSHGQYCEYGSRIDRAHGQLLRMLDTDRG